MKRDIEDTTDEGGVN